MRYLFSVLLVILSASAVASPDWRAEDLAWRQARAEKLQKPGGWLSLVGLDWLSEGRNSVGADPGNDVVLPRGPGRLGVAVRRDGTVRFCPESGTRPDIQPASDADDDGCVTLHSDVETDHPTTVSVGSMSFYLIDRTGHLGLRVKDSRANTRVNFKGLDYFPLQAEWRARAKFVPYDEPHTIRVPDATGLFQDLVNPGRLEFEKDGKSYSLEAVLENPGDEEFFVIFGDRTNGHSTYGAGRFLYTPMPDDAGEVIVDFNRAYNPPCVFTPYATCPLPPPENRLDVEIHAGEKMYAHGAHAGASGD